MLKECESLNLQRSERMLFEQKCHKQQLKVEQDRIGMEERRIKMEERRIKMEEKRWKLEKDLLTYNTMKEKANYNLQES